MVIAMVIDQYGLLSNGTAATARNFAEKLREFGHEVRVITAIPNAGERDNYVVKERYYPFITKLVRKHSMFLAKPEVDVINKALDGADIAHCYLQFDLAKKVKDICDKRGIASTAACHFNAENITYNIGLGWFKFLNDRIYVWWRGFFDKFAHVHTPSAMMKNLLLKYGYKSAIHPISNGVNDAFAKREAKRPSEYNGKFLILTVGRVTAEKRQDLLIKAVGQSKYNEKIQVIICGRGVKEKKLRKLGSKLLANPPQIKFVEKEELIDIINYCDLYVHAAEIESEAIACIEAFTCGRVPIISNAKLSATKQFALHPENLFEHENTSQLAQKIDYFIENPDVLKRMEKEYLEYAKNFRLDKCVRELEKVFVKAIEENSEQVKKYTS
jgi:glycosyltransferase involved in cell wall biosynthesis